MGNVRTTVGEQLSPDYYLGTLGIGVLYLGGGTIESFRITARVFTQAQDYPLAPFVYMI